MQAPRNRQRCFESYYKAQVHQNSGYYELRGDYTMNTYAFVSCTINGEEQRFWAQNDPPRHVVHVVIEKLNNKIADEGEKRSKKEDKTKVIVKMYTNKSPCNSICDAHPDSRHTCCSELISFKNRQELDVELEIIFSGLYNVRRKFCLVNILFPGLPLCAEHYSRVNEDESTANKQGLRNMDLAGIELRTFQEQDWSLLERELKVRRVEADAQQREDQAMADDDSILRLNDSRENVDARQREDQAMADDLDDILHETDQIVMKGESVTLSYTPVKVSRDTQLSKVVWYKWSAEPEPSVVTTADLAQHTGGTTDHPALTILEVDVFHSGSYFCKVETSDGVTDFSRTTHLLVNPQKRIFVRAGQSVELDSYPVKMSKCLRGICWYKNPVGRVENDGEPLSGLNYDPKSLKPRLKILKAEETDSGYYHCKAKHDYRGELRSRITQLIVGNPPPEDKMAEKVKELRITEQSKH